MSSAKTLNWDAVGAGLNDEECALAAEISTDGPMDAIFFRNIIAAVLEMRAKVPLQQLRAIVKWRYEHDVEAHCWIADIASVTPDQLNVVFTHKLTTQSGGDNAPLSEPVETTLPFNLSTNPLISDVPGDADEMSLVYYAVAIVNDNRASHPDFSTSLTLKVPAVWFINRKNWGPAGKKHDYLLSSDVPVSNAGSTATSRAASDAGDDDDRIDVDEDDDLAVLRDLCKSRHDRTKKTVTDLVHKSMQRDAEIQTLQTRLRDVEAEMRRVNDANARLRKDYADALAQLDDVRKQTADMRSQMQAEIRVMRAWNASQTAAPAAAAAHFNRDDNSAFVEDEAVTYPRTLARRATTVLKDLVSEVTNAKNRKEAADALEKLKEAWNARNVAIDNAIAFNTRLAQPQPDVLQRAIEAENDRLQQFVTYFHSVVSCVASEKQHKPNLFKAATAVLERTTEGNPVRQEVNAFTASIRQEMADRALSEPRDRGNNRGANNNRAAEGSKADKTDKGKGSGNGAGRV
jgi:hypothetical protein